MVSSRSLIVDSRLDLSVSSFNLSLLSCLNAALMASFSASSFVMVLLSSSTEVSMASLSTLSLPMVSSRSLVVDWRLKLSASSFDLSFLSCLTSPSRSLVESTVVLSYSTIKGNVLNSFGPSVAPSLSMRYFINPTVMPSSSVSPVSESTVFHFPSEPLVISWEPTGVRVNKLDPHFLLTIMPPFALTLMSFHEGITK